MTRFFVGVLVALLLPAAASANGRIEGRVTRPDGAGVPGVAVVLGALGLTAISDPNGVFSVESLPAGTYAVDFSLADNLTTRENVTVTDDATTRLDQVVDWVLRYTDTLTVFGASRFTERLFAAPASVGIVSGERLELESSQGQLPGLLQSVPGVDLTQNGVYDFNLNVRGFNSFLNRRLLVLIDGRDPGGVLLGAQEWSGHGLVTDDLARVELIRGPGSALYGANAYNGVVNFISKEPRYNQGGRTHASIGERGTGSVSLTQAGQWSDRTFFKVYGQASRTNDFYTSRATSTEYAGLPLEAREPLDRTYTVSFGGRVDRYVAGDRLLTFEGAVSQISGNMFATPIGRSQNNRVRRPWARASYTSGTWNLSSYYDGRNGGTFSMPSGLELFDDSRKLHVEGLRRFDLGPHGRLLGGAAFTHSQVDSADPAGVQTLFRGVASGRFGGVFGQFEYEPTSRLKTVLALRLDASTLHDTQVSPKASVAYALGSSQTLRASYGRAFQSASFVELFTRAPAAAPIDLGAIEQALRPVTGGVPLGLSSVPILAVGNDALGVETVNAVELGYSGVIGRRVVVSADYYRSRMKNFISTLLPQVGTSLGRINPTYGPYRPPAGLNAVQAATVTGTLQAVLPPSLFALMSNDLDGTPAFVAASFTNFGLVNAQGLDLGVELFEGTRWAADVSYSWFDFNVDRDLPDDPISANSAPHRVSAGLMYTAAPYSASVRYRWSHEFEWKSGVFRGPVPSFAVVDAIVQRTLTPHLDLRLDVANLFNNGHYELFGGDILRRRAVVDLIVTW